MKAKLILYKRNGRESFMIRLSANQKKAYKSIEVPFNTKDWNYDPSHKKNELRKIRIADNDVFKRYVKNKNFIKEEEDKYNTAIDELLLLGNPFSFQKVFDMVSGLLPDKTIPNTVYGFYKKRIDEMRRAEKYGNAETNNGTLNKLKSFHRKDLLFNELTPDLLLKFKESMKKAGNSKSTIGIHLRNIRATFNSAIDKGVAKPNDNPFRNKEIMKGLTIGYKSKALSREEVNEIRNIRKRLAMATNIWHACNYFMIGYLSQGTNFQDLARLKWENISDGRIYFVRRKTRGKIEEETSFLITEEIAEILEYYRVADRKLNNPYIFPILNERHKSEISKFNRIKKVRKQVNKDLKSIGEEIGSSVLITTYTWRHTFASVSKNELKLSTEMIRDLIGHKDIKTTQHYLAQFSNDDKDAAIIGL
jgi:integrase